MAINYISNDFFYLNLYPTKTHQKWSDADCIVPRISDTTSNAYQSNGRQSEYMTLCWNACKKIIDILMANPSITFDRILETTGNERLEIAHHFDEFENKMGVLRSTSDSDKIATGLFHEYQSMRDDLENLTEKNTTMDWEIFTDQIKIGFRKGVTFKNEEINLSNYILSTMPQKSTLAHTYPKNLPKALEHCTHLFNEILRLDSKSHGTHIHRLIASLHWWLSQATFFKRGSASCSEIIIGALLKVKFGVLSPYKIGIYADRIALVTSEEEFVKIYDSLREK